MWLVLIEAGVAFFLLVFIVWWTMFLGPKVPHDEVEARETREEHDADEALNAPQQPDPPDRPDRQAR